MRWTFQNKTGDNSQILITLGSIYFQVVIHWLRIFVDIETKNTKEAWSAASPSHVTSSEQRSTTSPHEFSLSAASLFSGLPGKFFSCDEGFYHLLYILKSKDTCRILRTSTTISNYLTKINVIWYSEWSFLIDWRRGLASKFWVQLLNAWKHCESPERKWSFSLCLIPVMWLNKS